MIQRIAGIAIAFLVAGDAMARDPVSFPKDVPPVLGTAVVSDAGKDDELEGWKIRLTLPKIAWEVVGVKAKPQWPELRVQVEKATVTLQMGGVRALSPSSVVDLKGKELTRDQVIKRLEKETPVLVSVSGRMPEAYFLQLTNSDALVVILGPRDDAPVPGFLPAKQASPTKHDKGREK